jgi:glutaredoxin-like protein NrdH
MERERYPLKVIVYTEPGCAGCEQVKKFLHARKIDFIEKDIFQDLTAVSELRRLGHVTVPVTRVGTEVIVGFDLGALERQFGVVPATSS